MKATDVNLLRFLKQSPQFTIPIYQRTYSWTESQCRQFWDDIMRAGSDQSVQAHFIGSVVYIQESLFHVSTQTPLLVLASQHQDRLRDQLYSLLLQAAAAARSAGDLHPGGGDGGVA